MRILYLNTTYSGGGAERVTRQIYDGMKKRGHEVYEIVCYNRRGQVEDSHVHVLYEGIAGKILLRVQTGNRGNANLTIPYAIWYISCFVKKNKIDVIHLNNPHDSFLGIRNIRKLQKLCPVVWTLHDFWALTGHCAFPFGCDDRWKKGCISCEHLGNYPRLRRDVSGRLFEEKKKWISGSGIYLTVPSDWMKKQVEESYLKDEPCEVICNSLDLTKWKVLDKQAVRKKYGFETDKMILAFVAADMKIPQKGMYYLMKVLEQLDPKKYALIVAGKSADELEKIKSHFEIKDFGYIKDQAVMNEFYALADVMVNPSVYETFGLVNIEAMASGTPVLSFPVCVMPEVIGVDGGWQADEVSADSMRIKIEDLKKSPEEIENKIKTCRKSVEMRYDEQKMLDSYEELYRKL